MPEAASPDLAMVSEEDKVGVLVFVFLFCFFVGKINCKKKKNEKQKKKRASERVRGAEKKRKEKRTRSRYFHNLLSFSFKQRTTTKKNTSTSAMRSCAFFFLLAALVAVALTSPQGFVSCFGCGQRGKRGGDAGIRNDDAAAAAALSSPTSPSSSSHHRLDLDLDVVDLSTSRRRRTSSSLDRDKEREPFTPPWFCHDLECPRFDKINETGDYETRRLAPTRWATTDVEAYSIATAQANGFTRLFDYISGKNKEQRKIEMTAPVLTHVSPGAGPFCKSKYSVSFYVGEAGTAAPAPTDDSDVYLRDAPAATVFVASKGGFVVEDYSVAAMAKGLADALERDGVRPHRDHAEKGGFWTAGYDPPFRLRGR